MPKHEQALAKPAGLEHSDAYVGMVLSPLVAVSAVMVLRLSLAIASTKVCRAIIHGMTVRSRHDETRAVALRLGCKY